MQKINEALSGDFCESVRKTDFGQLFILCSNGFVVFKAIYVILYCHNDKEGKWSFGRRHGLWKEKA